MAIRPDRRTERSAFVRGILIGPAIVFVGMGLAWACVISAITAYYTEENPALALRWDSADPAALSEAAWQRFERAETPKDQASAARDAQQALVLAPMNTLAMRVLALHADGVGEEGRARALMEVVGARSWRDTITQTWLFEDDLRRQAFDAASFHADAILRRRSELGSLLFPLMIASLRDRRGVAPIVSRLVEAPWRPAFLNAITSKNVDPATAEQVYQALVATDAPPTDTEVTGLLTQLIAERNYQAAHAEWAKFLGKTGGDPDASVYDGNFKGLRGARPFNWRFLADDGAIAEFARTDDGSPVLHVQAPAVRETPLVEQLLVLSPGTYKLSGRALMEMSEAGGGFSWRIECRPNNDNLLAEVSQVAGPEGWQSFTVAFSVPSQGCDGQMLRLVGLAHDGFEPTEAWYRELSLIKEPPATHLSSPLAAA